MFPLGVETFAKVLPATFDTDTVKEGPFSLQRVSAFQIRFKGSGVGTRGGATQDIVQRLDNIFASLLARACGMQLRRLSSACDPTLLHSVRRCQTA